MATYYVRKTGSDSNDGTTPATAWATIGKAVGAAGIASGDTVYVGAGRYAETVTVSMTNPTVETRIIGDVDGAQTGDAGPVVITAFTSGDNAGPSTNPALSLATRDYLTFENFVLVGGNTSSNGTCIYSPESGGAASEHITFRNCQLFGYFNSGNRTLVYYLNTPSVPSNWLIDSCTFFNCNTYALEANFSDSADANNYDVGFEVRNCLFLFTEVGIRPVSIDGGGVGTGKPGGFLVHNCTILSSSQAVYAFSAANGWDTANPVKVYNSIAFSCAGAAIQASSLGQLVEDYNIRGPLTNVSAGANSVGDSGRAFLPQLLQNEMIGLPPGTAFTPWNYADVINPYLGFGSDVSVSLTTDLLGRPRPAGGQSTLKALGALEAHDTGAIATDQFDVTPSLVLVGPADHDISLILPDGTHTISVKVRYDTNHGTTNKPQATIVANGEVGVSAETVTATVGVDTWETLTFAPITLSDKSVITLRLISRAEAGSGKAWFDTVAIS